MAVLFVTATPIGNLSDLSPRGIETLKTADLIIAEDTRVTMKLGQVFVANGWQKPDGFCGSAWDTVSPFVMALAHGAEDFYDGWMKNKKSAMISCNDGFRPVSFLLEALEEDAE